jgi:hypothetical protein
VPSIKPSVTAPSAVVDIIRDAIRATTRQLTERSEAATEGYRSSPDDLLDE